MFKKLFFSLLILSPSFSFAATSDLPFTDVSIGASYYAPLKHMYDAGVIGSTSDWLFRPDGLLPRDEFVWIAVGVSCQKCLSPSIEDMIRYSTNPFIDILKKNQYFYCISYAKEKEIVRGYTLDSAGNTQCQDGKNFSEVPFCPANNITRIEAVAVLLRQSGLWNESYNNSPYEKKIALIDVDSYWYGYAQKAVESGLIAIDGNKKIFPNEYITRKEFVIMASKIFTINMCQVKNNKAPADFASVIKIFDKEKQNCSESENITIFPSDAETVYDFGWYATGSLTTPLWYDWIFINSTTWEQKTATGSCLDNFNLESTGSWLVKLIITDAVGHSSTAYQQVSVKNTGLSVQIGNVRNPLTTASTTLYGTVDVPMPFFSNTVGWDGNYSYHWDFSDGGTATDKDPFHVFTREGIYGVPLTVHDTSGNTAYAELTVILSPNLDRDNDGIRDYSATGNILDVCPDVFGAASNRGCPFVGEYSANGTIADNLCLSDKIQVSGMIEWTVQCVSCPCEYSSEFIAQIRSCDIIFPSITSPDKKTLYSRGSIFPVP
ncbi:MAG: fibronectin type III protein [uncultured bacterium (gcode 4)]|uniref:Fibronectin type III protein n=1 Tax=uncultured bacterium (gcode 4) TaxID=1234023 RepID=K1XZ10_9BACT|nr:MAG: fibronectin type III protein [uncultured bacterium (gcode 4)]